MSPSQAWVDTDKVPKELRSIKKFLQEFIYDVDENSSQIAIYKIFEKKSILRDAFAQKRNITRLPALNNLTIN